jgi:hypothetical protein
MTSKLKHTVGSLYMRRSESRILRIELGRSHWKKEGGNTECEG